MPTIPSVKHTASMASIESTDSTGQSSKLQKCALPLLGAGCSSELIEATFSDNKDTRESISICTNHFDTAKLGCVLKGKVLSSNEKIYISRLGIETNFSQQFQSECSVDTGYQLTYNEQPYKIACKKHCDIQDDLHKLINEIANDMGVCTVM